MMMIIYKVSIKLNLYFLSIFKINIFFTFLFSENAIKMSDFLFKSYFYLSTQNSQILVEIIPNFYNTLYKNFIKCI